MSSPTSPRRVHPRAARAHRFLLFALALCCALGLAIGATPAPVSAATSRVATNTNVDGAGSFRRAILNADDGDTITFDASAFNPANGPYTITTGTLGDLAIRKSLTIDGPGAAILTISGGDRSRVFDIADYRAQVTIRDLTIANGEALRGAGILNSATLTLSNVVIRDNHATGDGGGIFNNGSLFGFGVLKILSSTIMDNRADGSGGGLENAYTAKTKLILSTVSGNRASRGGGIDLDTFFMNLPNIIESYGTTIANNTATVAGGGGGVRLSGAVGGALGTTTEFVAHNTILADNPGGNVSIGLIYSHLFSRGHNLSSDATTAADFTDLGDRNGVDPLLGPLANNGGPTPTHALLPGSPAIDAGTCVAPQIFAPPPTNRDQRGTLRPQRNTCDIGSFEFVFRASALATTHAQAQVGGTATLTATLTQPGLLNQPLRNKTIRFTIAGNPVCGQPQQPACPRTDTNGVATLTAASVAELSAGLHLGAVVATFDGDTLFLPSSASANLTLIQIIRP